MRESLRRDNSIELHSNDGDDDMVVLEPIVVGFVPRNLRCGCCGAPQRPWSWRAVDGGAELVCHRCHRELAVLGLGTKVHHG
jgi:hypothetical protein